MAGSTIGFDTSGVKIDPSLLRKYYAHQQGVNQGLRREIYRQSPVPKGEKRRVEIQQKKSKTKK